MSEYDAVTLVATGCNNISCLESETHCDCGHTYHVEVNDRRGWGTGGWVLDSKKGEIISLYAFGVEFNARNERASSCMYTK